MASLYLNGKTKSSSKSRVLAPSSTMGAPDNITKLINTGEAPMRPSYRLPALISPAQHASERLSINGNFSGPMSPPSITGPQNLLNDYLESGTIGANTITSP